MKQRVIPNSPPPSAVRHRDGNELDEQWFNIPPTFRSSIPSRTGHWNTDGEVVYYEDDNTYLQITNLLKSRGWKSLREERDGDTVLFFGDCWYWTSRRLETAFDASPSIELTQHKFLATGPFGSDFALLLSTLDDVVEALPRIESWSIPRPGSRVQGSWSAWNEYGRTVHFHDELDQYLLARGWWSAREDREEWSESGDSWAWDDHGSISLGDAAVSVRIDEDSIYAEGIAPEDQHISCTSLQELMNNIDTIENWGKEFLANPKYLWEGPINYASTD